jgi:hypothetical protein
MSCSTQPTTTVNPLHLLTSWAYNSPILESDGFQVSDIDQNGLTYRLKSGTAVHIRLPTDARVKNVWLTLHDGSTVFLGFTDYKTLLDSQCVVTVQMPRSCKWTVRALVIDREDGETRYEVQLIHNEKRYADPLLHGPML